MKKITNTLMLLAMLGIVLTSCKKDEEEPTPATTNTFSIDGTEYSLSAGYTEEYGGSETSGYNFDLTLFSSGITATADDGLSGQGEALYFELWSPSATGLAAGTYTSTIDEAPNTFTVGEVYINLNVDTFSVGEEYDVTAGTVTISLSGSNYSVTFDLTLTGGKKLTGNYTGALAEY